MSENNHTSEVSNIGSTLIFITFLVLKLTHVIDWSWWWVFAPFWIPLGIILICFLFLAIIQCFVAKK